MGRERKNEVLFIFGGPQGGPRLGSPHGQVCISNRMRRGGTCHPRYADGRGHSGAREEDRKETGRERKDEGRERKEMTERDEEGRTDTGKEECGMAAGPWFEDIRSRADAAGSPGTAPQPRVRKMGGRLGCLTLVDGRLRRGPGRGEAAGLRHAAER
eukprot:gene14257-biopygen11716